jgi:hypothetical protein
MTGRSGPLVLSPAALALLAPALRLLARLARRDGRELDPELAGLLAACEVAEHALRRRSARMRGSSLAPAASTLPRSSSLMTAGQAARVARTSDRAIRAAAAAGRLAGRRGGDGRWRFEAEEVERWSSSRTRRTA